MSNWNNEWSISIFVLWQEERRNNKDMTTFRFYYDGTRWMQDTPKKKLRKRKGDLTVDLDAMQRGLSEAMKFGVTEIYCLPDRMCVMRFPTQLSAAKWLLLKDGFCE